MKAFIKDHTSARSSALIDRQNVTHRFRVYAQ
jgi:hypothetical protein